MSTYTIVQIPGWESLSLQPRDRRLLEQRIDELAHGAVPDDVPRDTATPFRQEMRKHLTRLVEQAQSAGADVITLPVEARDGYGIPASYTVSEWRDPDPDGTAPGAVLEALAASSEAQAELVELDGRPALREELIVAADPDADELASHPARRVSYTISSPVDAAAWVIFTFVTLGEGDPDGPLARLLVELFDAHLTTLRWSTNGGGPST